MAVFWDVSDIDRRFRGSLLLPLSDQIGLDVVTVTFGFINT